MGVYQSQRKSLRDLTLESKAGTVLESRAFEIWEMNEEIIGFKDAK